MKLSKLLLSVTCLFLIGCNKNNSTSTKKNIYLFFGNYNTRVETVNVGDKYTAPSDVVINPGYNFVGWYLNPSCSSTLKATFPMEIIDDVYLYANYKIKTFSVIYHLNNSKAFVKKITKFVDWGQRLFNYDASGIVKDEKFLGWYYEASCETPYNFESSLAYSNIELYAKWEKE